MSYSHTFFFLQMDSDDALLRRINAYKTRLEMLGPTMRSVVQRHVSTSSSSPALSALDPPQSSTQQLTEPIAAPSRFGLMRKKKDPLEKLFAAPSANSSAKTAFTTTVSHWSFRKCSEMLDVSWEAFRQEFGIQVQALSFRSAGGLHGLNSSSVHPARCWGELSPSHLSTPCLRDYLDARFAFPTAIQSQSLPITTWRAPGTDNTASSTAAQGGKLDLLGVAETGSGKTMCYLIPIFEHILNEEFPMTPARAELGPLALILVPTRELADQVYAEAERIRTTSASSPQQTAHRCCTLSSLKIAKIVGGESVEAQHQVIAQGVHLMIGTPGQLDALLEQRYLSLGNTRLVAIDEADRMVEERMTDQLCNVLQHAPTPRQTIMFTATMLPECQDIATKFLSPRGYFVLRTPYTFQSVWQRLELFPITDGGIDSCTEVKLQRLTQWIAFQPGKQTIVFANEKNTCDLIVKRLRELGTRLQRGLDEVLWSGGGGGGESSSTLGGGGGEDVTFRWLGKQRNSIADGSAFSRVAAAHSGLTQQERKNVIQQFQSGQLRVLVTTDLLARGLDVEKLELVVNFELPDTREHKSTSGSGEELALMKYIHRIGRTGRAGNKGISVSLVTLPLDLVQRSATVMMSTVASNKSVGSDVSGSGGRRAVAELGGGNDDDDALEQALGGDAAKRQRDDGNAPAERSGGGDANNDSRMLAPMFRFLRDCAIHSGATRSEDTFFAECRKHEVPRCTVPEPLLLSMQCSSKRLTLGAIRH
ncbi:ATP-dependent DEAD/DEAH box RNA helicase, putative [Bodo saltans]|uniref:RNA helicase n=1 Tax=Bodo saltans TaxID=75058 RepID=A0A0S4IKX9_BODSA|nr:ATP-dependent DEAD/DEAH box RNA helicase, putative [Bodo saltans]|eukprot:CUE69617.1 ATP-dependent DEAD/DEAH box RNA helicase, putative [Bodo saltans]